MSEWICHAHTLTQRPKLQSCYNIRCNFQPPYTLAQKVSVCPLADLHICPNIPVVRSRSGSHKKMGQYKSFNFCKMVSEVDVLGGFYS